MTCAFMIAKKNLIVRALSGAVYVALIVVALVLPTEWGLWTLLSFFAVAAIIEYNLLTSINRERIFRVVLDAAAPVWLLYAVTQHGSQPPLEGGIFLPYLLYLFFVVVRSTFLDPQKILQNVGNSLISQIYIALPLALAMRLTLFPEWSMGFDGRLLLCVFILVWVNDTGAYLVGSTMGKHPLAPKLSPKKTVEGAVGGLLIALLTAMFALPYLVPQFDCWQLLLLSLAVTLFGTLGDLFESALKRQAGVKDSGNLIPGHGGILDRIDSVLFAVPAVYLLIQIFELYR